MIKIKICTQYPKGACSYYRTMGTFSKLSKISQEPILIEQLLDFDWHSLSDADIVVFERPINENFLKAMEFTKNFGIKVWADIDDDFFSVPKYNPAHKVFSKKETTEHIEKCLSLTDVLTVTTPALKEKYKKFCNRIEIVENAFNDYNFTLLEHPSKNNIINWRGSKTHRNDILSCLIPMMKVSEENKETLFHFIGNDLWYIENAIKNIGRCEEKLTVEYFNFIKQLNPKIQICPLEFNEFNISKSNISWIEGIYSGAVCVGPDMPEWRLPGIETYKTPDEFYEKVTMLLNDNEKRIKNFYESLNYIKENLLLSIVNKKRLEIINSLCK
jgi:hypothetical protein